MSASAAGIVQQETMSAKRLPLRTVRFIYHLPIPAAPIPLILFAESDKLYSTTTAHEKARHEGRAGVRYRLNLFLRRWRRLVLKGLIGFFFRFGNLAQGGRVLSLSNEYRSVASSERLLP